VVRSAAGPGVFCHLRGDCVCREKVMDAVR
jgi:hypothetical protein